MNIKNNLTLFYSKKNKKIINFFFLNFIKFKGCNIVLFIFVHFDYYYFDFVVLID